MHPSRRAHEPARGLSFAQSSRSYDAIELKLSAAEIEKCREGSAKPASPAAVELAHRRLGWRALGQCASRPGPYEDVGVVVQSKPAGVPRSGLGATDTPSGLIAWQRLITSQS